MRRLESHVEWGFKAHDVIRLMREARFSAQAAIGPSTPRTSSSSRARRFVIGGIRDVDAFDGAIVGERVGGELHYRGVVERGFKARDVVTLMREARPFADLRTMRNAVWLEPRLLADVSCSEIIDGRLRAPSWRGLVVEDRPLMPTRLG